MRLVPNGNDRPGKALEAARDVVKQLVTIDAALLTFGISFVQNISKSRGPTGWIDIATIALLVSLLFGVVTLFSIVSETNASDGTINAGLLRGSLVVSMAAFVAAAGCIGWYVLQAPKPLPS